VWLTIPQWCSLCNDIGSILVLCSGCRVGICLLTHQTVYGCLRWQEGIENDDFIFLCPFCAWKTDDECSVWLPERPVRLATKYMYFSLALSTNWASTRGATLCTDMTHLSSSSGPHGTKRNKHMWSHLSRPCVKHTMGMKTTYGFNVAGCDKMANTIE
jgi:hypothetical protein